MKKKNNKTEQLNTRTKSGELQAARRSPAPFYAAAACWILYALVLPLYRLSDFFIAAAISLAAFGAFRKLYTPQIEETEQDTPETQTGDSNVDRIITEGRDYLRQIREINNKIPDPELSAKMDRLEDITRKIFDHILQNPRKIPQVRRFMSYYLPTTLKLLNAYHNLSLQGVDGDNIRTSMNDITLMMDSVILAFEKQLDNLFEEDALDISTDISVMETMLAQEGLSESDFNLKKQ
jgi:5-bromo-4-chloroindolyl phosphate hydrolysis protein